ncbi:MAG: FmdB family zinc ribbon protein, partial [Burkholderiaceae bacterium]
MPIYAYRCASCGHSRDVLQKISDPVLTTCPACGVDQFQKQVTAAGFQLKGSGWYVTDFRGDKKSAKPADSDPPAAQDKTAGGAEGKDATSGDAAAKKVD